MVLTQSQRALIERARAAGGGELGTGLSEEMCVFIAATVARDLQLLDKFPEIGDAEFPGFFDEPDPRKLEIPRVDFNELIQKLFDIVNDADTYFACLASLQKSRLKFASSRISTNSHNGSGRAACVVAVRSNEFESPCVFSVMAEMALRY